MNVPYVASILADLARAPPPEGEPLFLHLGDFEGEPVASAPSAVAFRRAQRRLTDRVFAAASLSDGQDVLEVGCGFGANLACLDTIVSGARLVGLDAGRPQLDVARARVRGRGANQLAWVEGDACALPYERHTFDRVLAIECAFHFASRRAFFAEVARVLRPGGLVALTDLVPTAHGRAAHRSGDLPASLGAVLATDLAPFPDPWGDEGSCLELAKAEGLHAVVVEDRTHAALPSFAFIFRGKVPELSSPHVADRGAAALGFLLERGYFRLELAVLEPGEP